MGGCRTAMNAIASDSRSEGSDQDYVNIQEGCRPSLFEVASIRQPQNSPNLSSCSSRPVPPGAHRMHARRAQAPKRRSTQIGCKRRSTQKLGWHRNMKLLAMLHTPRLQGKPPRNETTRAKHFSYRHAEVFATLIFEKKCLVFATTISKLCKTL